MESVTNIVIGFPLALITWHFTCLAMDIPMPLGDNIIVTTIFTVVSLLRSYALRRMFNGRTVWQAISAAFQDRGWRRVEW